MKTLLTAVTFAVAAAGFAFGAAAQEVDPAEQAGQEPVEARADREADPGPFCIQQTGSRIIASRNARPDADRVDCVASTGRVHTREDLERTGSTNLADALRRLDPSIR